MTEVKICGVSDPAAMDAVAEAGADWVGFNFFPPSPRAITPCVAKALAARHPSGPRPVGLFVEPTDDEIEDALGALDFAALQIHASPERAASLQTTYGIPVWHVVGVAGAMDLPTVAHGVSRLLLDRKATPGAALPGGNAAAFEWGVLDGWRPPRPWILAGGLTVDTVAGAIVRTHAPTVDVSSGVERARGVKDPALIHAFVAAVRAA